MARFYQSMVEGPADWANTARAAWAAVAARAAEQPRVVRVGYVQWPEYGGTWAKTEAQARNNWMFRIGARG